MNYYEGEYWQQRCVELERELERRRRIRDDRLRKLIALCHPDRHDNSDMANEITAWLLEVKRKSKEEHYG